MGVARRHALAGYRPPSDRCRGAHGRRGAERASPPTRREYLGDDAVEPFPPPGRRSPVRSALARDRDDGSPVAGHLAAASRRRALTPGLRPGKPVQRLGPHVEDVEPSSCGREVSIATSRSFCWSPSATAQGISGRGRGRGRGVAPRSSTCLSRTHRRSPVRIDLWGDDDRLSHFSVAGSALVGRDLSRDLRCGSYCRSTRSGCPRAHADPPVGPCA